MSQLEQQVLDRFKAVCAELNVGLGDYEMCLPWIHADVSSFEDQERSYGIGKTRRPDFGRKYFAELLERAAELKRRRDEDLGRLFGED